MQYKGRTVITFVVLGMVVSSLFTLVLVRPAVFSAAANTAAGASSSAALSAKDVDKISTAYGLIQKNFLNTVDREKVVNGAINGMLASLEDPYTVYMDQNEAKQFDDSSINSSFEGIGAEVANSDDGKVVIVSPIKGSPAEKAGLQAGDIIVSVNGEKLDGITLNQAVMKIRGTKGTQANLEIVRKGTDKPVQINIVRGTVDLETVHAEMLPDNIGKIEITQFSMNTAAKFKEELKALEDKGMKGLVIDVRNDPGGLLTSVREIADQFIPAGKTVLNVEDRQGHKEPTVSRSKEKAAKPYPITVLINKGSASASEILAAALQESMGIKLVGETSFGKGTVQVVFDKEMGDGSNIKMTTYKWLTPNGNWIHKKGITPDIAVEQPAYFKATALSKKTVLKPDTNGDDVKNVQLMLQGLGLNPERMDGYFSDKTALAVKAFQRLNNLPMTGEVDTATADKLVKAIIAEIKNSKNDAQLKAAVQQINSALGKN